MRRRPPAEIKPGEGADADPSLYSHQNVADLLLLEEQVWYIKSYERLTKPAAKDDLK